VCACGTWLFREVSSDAADEGSAPEGGLCVCATGCGFRVGCLVQVRVCGCVLSLEGRGVCSGREGVGSGGFVGAQRFLRGFCLLAWSLGGLGAAAQ
jgi:hypothetical protein